jgi:hypothetical protein
MENLVIFGLPAALIITGLIQALKKAWPDTFSQPRWAITAALCIGVGLGAIAAVAQPCGGAACWLRYLLAGLLAALASSGFYDTIRTVQAQRKQ